MKKGARARLCAAALIALGLAAVFLVRGWTERGKNWIKSAFRHPWDRIDSIDEATARRLFPARAFERSFRYDPIALLLPVENRVESWDWPEHPRKRITMRTNNLGFREDEPTEPTKRGLRVLVAGDSHTQGLVENDESFANRLERLWSEGHGDCEVLNAGTAYTGPYCYLGRLRKFLYLEPDVFVAALYLGNDFADDLMLRYALDGWSVPSAEDYSAPLMEAAERWPGPVSQGLNQAYRFKWFPGEAERSLEIVLDSFGEMDSICRREGILFLALVIPTKADVDRLNDREAFDAAREKLGLDSEDCRIHALLGRKFAQALTAKSIRCLDPTERMLAAEKTLYWRMDDHLGLEGHELLAELLRQELEEMLEERAPLTNAGE